MAGVLGGVYGVVALSHGDELVAAYSDAGPSCLIADFSTINGQISPLRARLVELAIELPMVCVMLQADVPAAVGAMKAGAVDFLAKPLDEHSFRESVRSALVQDEHRRAARARRDATARRIETLTARELDVLQLVVQGLTTRQIATALSISPKTVDTHRGQLFLKTGVESLAILVRLAVASGIASDNQFGELDGPLFSSGLAGAPLLAFKPSFHKHRKSKARVERRDIQRAQLSDG
jgi:two-component system response regulator FixJ